MKNEQDQEDLFKRQLSDPKSLGEKGQVDKIKRFSNDAQEIIQFKKELVHTREKIQSNQIEEEKAQEKKEESPKLHFSIPAPKLKRRRSDKPTFVKSKPKFLAVFMNILSLISLFKNKYKKSKRVRFSIFNFLTNGSFFHPDLSVTIFAQQEIISLQELLQPFLKEIYAWGWCDIKGKRILDPFGFNLISECERLMDKKSVEEFLYFPSNAEKSIGSLNAFIRYFYSVMESEENFILLLSNIQKILTVMSVSKEKTRVLENFKLISNLLNEMKNKNIEKNFLIPIFECFLSRPILKKEIESLVEIDSISTTEYYADARLFASMKSKEEQYEKYIAAKTKKIKALLDLIYIIKKDLNFEVKKATGDETNLMNYAVSKNLSKYKGLPHFESLQTHHKTFLAINYFLETYNFFLSKSVEIKKSIADEKALEVTIFDRRVFESEIYYLQNTTQRLLEIAEKSFRGDIFAPASPEGETADTMKIFLTALNTIADQVYSIGEKLNKYSDIHAKMKVDEGPISSSDLGKEKSLYHDYIVYQIPKRKFSDGYYFFQKKISDILLEIRAFCFQYTYHFESLYRNFPPEHNRQSSLKNLVSDQSNFEKKLKSLEKGDDVDF